MAGKTAVSARKKMCCCVRMLHQLPKNVFSSCLVSTLVITTHPPRCCVDHARLVADKLLQAREWQRGKSQKKPSGLCPIIAIAMAPPPGFFQWLFAIGELVSNKPCAILAASWSVSGDGQSCCCVETRDHAMSILMKLVQASTYEHIFYEEQRDNWSILSRSGRAVAP